MQRIFSILGWVGTALVFGAVAVRFVRPEWDQYGTWAAWVGLALVVLYTLGQWREILEYFRRRQARYGAVATAGVLVALAIALHNLPEEFAMAVPLVMNPNSIVYQSYVHTVYGMIDNPTAWYTENDWMEKH